MRRARPRLPRHRGDPVIAGRAVRAGTGRLPCDFPQRLRRLKDLAGCTWDDFAEALGVERKRVLGWLRGTEPHGGAYHNLVAVACRIPGGLRILLGEDLAATVREE